MGGNKCNTIKAISITIKKGKHPLIISSKLTSDSATPFVANKFIPTGGVMSPTSTAKIVTVAYHIGSIPAALIMGLNTGTVIHTFAMASTKHPRIKITILNIITIA